MIGVISNAIRRDRARRVLQVYTGEKGEAYEEAVWQITDIISDLLHLVSAIDADEGAVATALLLAEFHFETNQSDEEERQAEDALASELQAKYLQSLKENPGATIHEGPDCDIFFGEDNPQAEAPSLNAAPKDTKEGHEMTALPPDPEEMNDARASRAAVALCRFQQETGSDDDTALVDLLCDLMHWCDRGGADFDGALQDARMHYEAETSPEPDADARESNGEVTG
jgi:hypothetical protein